VSCMLNEETDAHRLLALQVSKQRSRKGSVDRERERKKSRRYFCLGGGGGEWKQADRQDPVLGLWYSTGWRRYDKQAQAAVCSIP
jgi:hypothetical protein